MTPLSDTIQIILTLPAYRFAACVALVVCLFQALRLVRVSWSGIVALLKKCVVPFWRLRWWAGVLAVSGILFLFSTPIHGFLQSLEYTYFNPVTLNETRLISNERAVSMYEAQLRQHCDSYEFEVVKRRTAETAAKINSTPQAIYEAALLECGLNPFRVRDDRVAAGWIQFTRVGLSGLDVSLDRVIQACRSREVEFIMDLTERYLVRKWERAGKPDMRNTIDLYLAIFAPAHIGAAPDKVVYAGFGNPAYELNAGLDGWMQDGQGRIVRGMRQDGKITVWEIYLCLERKKALLLKQKI